MEFAFEHKSRRTIVCDSLPTKMTLEVAKLLHRYPSKKNFKDHYWLDESTTDKSDADTRNILKMSHLQHRYSNQVFNHPHVQPPSC